MWDTLKALHEQVAPRRIETLFNAEGRAADYAIQSDGLLFDYSKTNINDQVRDELVALANNADWTAKRDAMFRGDRINITEDRSVLHTALRRNDGPLIVDGVDVMVDVFAIRERMLTFAEDIRAGRYNGQGGQITDVVNIGIGGSDLGPAMAVAALAPFADGPKCHFVSNVDGAHVADVLDGLNPETTLVIVASKTFTTIETMTNAQTARDWMASAVTTPSAQFAALSTDEEKTGAFGISPDRVFGFEDWVGGRYSVWGPIGLSLAIAIGADNFHYFLSGAKAMDDHFCDEDTHDNIPLMLALVGIWHAQICGYGTRAVLPYEQRLLRLPAYLQQLEMESNGKRVTVDGKPTAIPTGPIVWGEPGTNGQHAFYQLIHQGTRIVPCEFMVAAEGHESDLTHHHLLLQANCLAQSEALMLGRDFATAKDIAAQKGFEGDELDRQTAHRVFEGNRPSTTLCYPKLTPYVLGQIVAMYEHRVFAEGVILGINSFDQWGVELGKELATALGPILESGDASGKDGSTQQLVGYLTSC
ncbi:MAG: glucose-6-phosphate isomerase [Planktomarina sp.]